jgi:hypothetical protein
MSIKAETFGAELGRINGDNMVAISAALKSIINSQPHFDRENFKKEITNRIREPRATEIQKLFWKSLLE